MDRELHDAPDVLQFVNSKHAKELAFLGTSCPDHFIRTKIRPLFVPWAAGGSGGAQGADCRCAGRIPQAVPRLLPLLCHARFARLRDASPTVVLIPGLGMFSFGKNKTEARIVGEFYTNAIHVMEGATLLAKAKSRGTLPQCGEGMDPEASRSFPTTSRCRRSRPSASNTGRWKRPRFAASPGKGVQPAHRPGGGRSQRHWPRSGARWPRARSARDGRRPR
jgi:hypothetical protein